MATPAWLAGFEGAKAGLVMRTTPATGTPDWSQGLGPKVEYADRAKVRKVGERTCVPAGCYENVLVTEEWDAADPTARQLKYYASGVGNVRVGWAGTDEEKEELELTKVAQLSPEALAPADAEVRKLEQRAYKNAEAVFGTTAPAERLPG